MTPSAKGQRQEGRETEKRRQEGPQTTHPNPYHQERPPIQATPGSCRHGRLQAAAGKAQRREKLATCLSLNRHDAHSMHTTRPCPASTQSQRTGRQDPTCDTLQGRPAVVRRPDRHCWQLPPTTHGRSHKPQQHQKLPPRQSKPHPPAPLNWQAGRQATHKDMSHPNPPRPAPVLTAPAKAVPHPPPPAPLCSTDDHTCTPSLCAARAKSSSDACMFELRAGVLCRHTPTCAVRTAEPRLASPGHALYTVGCSQPLVVSCHAPQRMAKQRSSCVQLPCHAK